MGIFDIDLNNINLDDTNHDGDDPDTIILVRFLTWHIKFEKHEALKKRIKRRINRCQFFISESEEKRNRTNFYWVVILVRI